MRTAAALDLREYLEWVALGTVCDIVPLRHENRILAHAGLKYMRRHTGLGLTALIKVAGIHRDALSAYHLGYQLGPRLNAVGRMGSAVVGLDLLLSKDPQQAETLAQELDRANRERQEVEKQTLAQAETDVAPAFAEGREAPFSIVANGPGWHRGVVGIVASRLCRKYNRPSIVIGMDEDGMGRGSCRSIEGFDLMQALEQCGDLLEAFGGHRMAAGLEVSQEHLEPFRDRFEQAAREQLSAEDLVPVQRIDGWVRSEDLEDWVLMDAQKQLAPFGSEHPRPVWALHDARSASPPRPVGKEGDHLKFSFMGSSGARYSGIGFGMGKMTLPPEPWDVAFYLQENHFRGETHLDLVVQDIR
jgi:single-stranded-DNA-specific exonuclease